MRPRPKSHKATGLQRNWPAMSQVQGDQLLQLHEPGSHLASSKNGRNVAFCRKPKRLSVKLLIVLLIPAKYVSKLSFISCTGGFTKLMSGWRTRAIRSSTNPVPGRGRGSLLQPGHSSPPTSHIGQPALGEGHWASRTGRQALGVGHWATGTGRGALGERHWASSTGQAALDEGHFTSGTGRGALGERHCGRVAQDKGHWASGTGQGWPATLSSGTSGKGG